MLACLVRQLILQPSRAPLPSRTPFLARAMAVGVEKVALRKRVNGELKQLSAAEMAEESALIDKQVLAADVFQQAQRLAVYVHCARLREVDTTPLLEAALGRGARVYVPRVLDKDANMHFLHLDGPHSLHAVPPFGVREPLPEYADGTPREDVLEVEAALELVVMPGLAFDMWGRRLGRGGGYYDKFIAAAQARARARGWRPPLLAALAFRAQLVDSVPEEGWDQRVDLLLTPDGVIDCAALRQEAVSG